MADAKPIEQRIIALAREVYAKHLCGEGYVQVKVIGSGANLYVDGVCRCTVTAVEGEPLDALEQFLQRRVKRLRAGRS